jgi:hypothetical protein
MRTPNSISVTNKPQETSAKRRDAKTAEISSGKPRDAIGYDVQNQSQESRRHSRRQT